MFEDFLNHRCDIFHLAKKEMEGCYGIRTGDAMVPEQEPSQENVPCHFHTKSGSLRIMQEEPYRSLSGEIKLTLPAGTDIRENDVIRSRETGLCYRADLPRKIRNHHVTVTLRREDGVEGAL